MKAMTFEVNESLRALFRDTGLLLVDFKLEFGRFEGGLCLATNSRPMVVAYGTRRLARKWTRIASVRAWAGMVEAYEEMAHQLGVVLPA